MTLWVDASAGASGDMLLGALVGAGVPLDALQRAVDAVSPEPVTLRQEQVSRHGFAATKVHVDVADTEQHRSWRDIRVLLERADLDEAVRERALATFGRLAVAEATVHGTDPLDVSFHEVGALDAIADVVGACAGFVHLGSCRPGCAGAHAGPHNPVVVSPVAVGSGSVEGAHGPMPVPPPAVAELLRGAPSYAGPGAAGAPESGSGELCTPTGAALLTTLAHAWGPQPAMTTQAVGVGAGGRDPGTHANVLRLFVGETADHSPGTRILETNVDDLDPRVWPAVIAALMEAGASDAWLTPILMKKGRPAHTLSVLVEGHRADAVRDVVFRETSAIGLREHRTTKHALDREMVSVDVGGQPVAVKLARRGGTVVNAQPEYDDVARAARALGRAVADVLADAAAASRRFLGGQEPHRLDGVNHGTSLDSGAAGRLARGDSTGGGAHDG